ncbi:MAG: hypothetical protein HY921_00325 [Elusimicrobia bacterium]|nr:hypothetical protein [Elusimicrobiota bacterium]
MKRGGASVVLVLHDISRRKMAEETLRKAKAETESAYKDLEVFSYSVAHDLRAPVRKINGFCRALVEDCGGEIGPKGHEFLERLCAASQDMGRLIDSLLELSGVTRTELRLERVDLSALVESIAAGLRNGEPGRKVEFAVAPNLAAMADAHLLRSVLENLLQNAWKFTSKHARARIEFGLTQADGQAAYFIRDDGAGFDPAFAGKLFTPFQRLHGSAEFPGTGIGLATAQRIMRKHGGRIWTEGAVEKGAVFYFTLPGAIYGK